MGGIPSVSSHGNSIFDDFDFASNRKHRGGEVPDDVFATTIASTTIACHSSTAAAAASDLHEHVQLCIRLDLR